MSIDKHTDLSISQKDTATLQCVTGVPQPKIPKVRRKPKKTRLEQLPLSERPTVVMQATTAMMRAIRRVRVERLPEYFEQTCDWRQHGTAVICGSSQLTYQELDQRANRLAHLLISRGIGEGNTVGILLERSLDTYIALLGVLKAGAAFVPLDPSFHANWVTFIAEDAGLRSLITTSAFREKTSVLHCSVLELDLAHEALSIQEETRPQVRVDPASLCYIIYTLGTTSRPKGVAVSHTNIVNFLHVVTPIYGMTRHDRVYQGMSTAFDFSFEEIWPTWVAGATLIAGPTDSGHLGHGLTEFLVEHKITVFRCTPTLLATIESDVPSLRSLLIGGEPCSPDLVSQWARPGLRMLNTYGPTETTVTATWCELFPGRPVTIGSPLPTYYVYILDDQLRLVKDGESGEIYIGGSGVTMGYLNQPDLTKKRFVPNPIQHEQEMVPRLYRTGDLGRITLAGEIEYLGRINTRMNSSSYRIELDEIEQGLRTDPTVVKLSGTRTASKPEDQASKLKMLKQINLKNIYKNIMTDPLYRNSIFNMASTFILGGLGFFFWIIIARIYKPEDVGIATTLISIMGLLNSLTIMGLNSSLNRFLPKSSHKNELINSSFVIVTLVALVACAIFLLGLPIFSPPLVFLQKNIFYIISFTLFIIFSSWNMLVESIFMAFRANGNKLLKNGLIGVVKLMFPFTLIALGAYGIFVSSVSALDVGVISSVIILIFRFKIKPSLSVNVSLIKETLAYSFANYMIGFMSAMPSLILPVIILNVLSAKYAAYYFIASQIESLLEVIPLAAAEALLVEGAYDEEKLIKHTKKAFTTILVILVPAIAVIVFAGNILLQFFGKNYASEALQFLQLYSASTAFTALILIASAIMNVKRQIKSLIFLNAIATLLTLGLSCAFISGKLAGVGWGWILGQAIAGGISLFFIIRNTYVSKKVK
jgi:amino acid adenylation domain-containing protein